MKNDGFFVVRFFADSDSGCFTGEGGLFRLLSDIQGKFLWLPGMTVPGETECAAG